MLRYILGSGTYGNVENRVHNKVGDLGGGVRGKLRYAGRRLVLPMSTVKRAFPFFYKHKILLPFLPVYRTFKGLRRNRGRLGKEWETLKGKPERRKE